jgi:hypothetical protein|uniref:Uncharacterized protein n=1 Tax=Picea glauca TaxID=3330 RepID=A0A101LYX6_PICGL|nr:hypothetical protein ABT39_MTgene4921 [Picea glauca]QHR88618.1 hypothetical protein Q903MT_gene2632 [Picea sitchensis]
MDIGMSLRRRTRNLSHYPCSNQEGLCCYGRLSIIPYYDSGVNVLIHAIELGLIGRFICASFAVGALLPFIISSSVGCHIGA